MDAVDEVDDDEGDEEVAYSFLCRDKFSLCG
jgi:hypothetical protein